MARVSKSSVLRWAIWASIASGLAAPAHLYGQDALGESGGRDKPWANLVSEEVASSTGVPTREQGMGPVNGEALPSTWERAQQNPDFGLLADQIDSNDQRLLDARNRVIDLETMIDQAWEELSPSSQSGFQTTGSGYNYGAWTPGISTQTSDFRQDRSYSQDYVKVMEVYETNKFSKETRLARTYNVNETRTLTDSRVIDVANNPNGGANGWSAWRNYGGVYSCSGYSPSPTTVNSGQQFTQTRSCSQQQEAFIYYLAAGAVIDDRRQTRIIAVSQSRTSTGTKPVFECSGAQSAYARSGLSVANSSFEDSESGNWQYRSQRIVKWGSTVLDNRIWGWSRTPVTITKGQLIRNGYTYWTTNVMTFGSGPSGNRYPGLNERWTQQICREQL